MAQWLTNLAQGLVKDRQSVEVSFTQDDRGVLFELLVAREDVGRIIGKGGATIKILRELLRMAGSAQQMTATLRFEAPDRNY